jgi:uncharacterized protein (DUF2062 family)
MASGGMNGMKWFRPIYYYLIRLLRLKGSARIISIGFVMGFYPCWFPTFGVGPLLSVMITRWFRGSVVAASIAAALGSFLWPVLFYINYLSGSLLFKVINFSPAVTEQGDEIDYTKVAEETKKLTDVGVEFLLGGFINSIIFSFALYYLLVHLFSHYRTDLLKFLIKLRPKKQ